MVARGDFLLDCALILPWLGHVEKTNDRDYEVEERYNESLLLGRKTGGWFEEERF